MRLERHNAGHSKATRHGVPWILEHSESFPTRAEGIKRGRYFKTGRGRDELDNVQRQSGRRGDRSWVPIPPARRELLT
jgi:putative endonuclease